MRLLLDNSYAMIVDASRDQIQALNEHFSVLRKDRIFFNRWAKERWEPVRLIQGNLMPTGLVPTALKVFGEKFSITVEDTRRAPLEKDVLPARADIRLLEPPKLFDFQTKAVEFAKEKARAIIVGKTGSGKTFMMGSLIHHYCRSTLVLVGSKSPMVQIKDKLGLFIDPAYIGLVGGKHRDENYITIATYASAKKLPLHEYEVIMIDEVHHAAAATYQEILKYATNAYYRFGVTGTPTGRSDGLEMLTDAVISSDYYTIPKEEIKEQLGMPSTTVGLIDIKLPYNAQGVGAYDTVIVNNTEVNDIISKIAVRFQEKTVLIYVERLQHGHNLNQLIPGSIFVHGDTSVEDRDMILKNIKGRVVICTEVFGESIDTQDIGVIINASGNRSPIRIVQLLGRAMRGGSDKEVLAFDFIHRDGATFERRSKKRVTVWKQNCDIVNKIHHEGVVL